MPQTGTEDQVMIPSWVEGDLRPVDKLEVHLQGLKHKAVSVFLICGDHLLIQRRALEKYHTPGLWANTCCTHPFWDEAPLDCAHRRLEQELGLVQIPLHLRSNVEYRADVGGGMIEHEVVDIFVGQVEQQIAPRPNPAEVMDTRWIAMPDLLAEVAREPERFTPWMRIYLETDAARLLAA